MATTFPIGFQGPGLPDRNGGYLYDDRLKIVPEIIKDSIIQILGTRVGTRIFNPTFGSKLWQLIFDFNDPITHALADQYTRDALALWEPRIQVNHVDVMEDPKDPHGVQLKVTFTILQSLQIENVLFNITVQNPPLPVTRT